MGERPQPREETRWRMIEQNSVFGRRTQGPALGKSLSISVVVEHTWANLLERERFFQAVVRELLLAQ